MLNTVRQRDWSPQGLLEGVIVGWVREESKASVGIRPGLVGQGDVAQGKPRSPAGHSLALGGLACEYQVALLQATGRIPDCPFTE